jgi:hypothetical protein
MPAVPPPSASVPSRLRLPRGFLPVSVLSLLAARGHAESSLTFKNQSWQEEDERIRVDSQYALLDAELSAEARLKVMGLIDTIAGATPTGEKPGPDGELPTARMEDKRKAWNAEFAWQFPRVNVSAGYGLSRESDYVSHGYSLNTLTDFNRKNTLLRAGWGHTDDRLMQSFWSKDREKTGDDLILGVTQLLSPVFAVTVNLAYGHAEGFLSDPYKIVSTTRLALDPGTYYTPPENRPREKDRGSLFLGVNRHFERLDAALDGSYRFYHDSFGIDSHTVELKWLQRAGAHLILEPCVRYYWQSEADFYYHDLDAAGIVTNYDPLLETGTGRGPFYSSDHRLSEMETITLGLKVTWVINPHCSVDFAFDRYLMQGLDEVTPSAAYSDANVITLGLKLSR